MKTLSAVFATSTFVKRVQVKMEQGVIAEVGDLGIARAQIDHYFEDDCLAFCGMGDIHIHAREDVSQKNVYKEDFHTAGLAAINGGVTFTVDMPNNPIPPIDDESYLAKLALVDRSKIPLFIYAGIGPGTSPLSFKVPYKAYMGPSVGELFFKDDLELEQAIERYRGKWVSFHCEDPVELEKHKHAPTHAERRPHSCEILATRTALRLIETYGLQGKLCHYSAGEGLALIRAAKERGVSVTCEVTPQHLYFSLDQLDNPTIYQMNPPIRERSDCEQLLEGLRSGLIDYLATDHAPHTMEEKIKGTSGLTGLDTYAPLVAWLIKDKGFDPKLVARFVAENPGRFVNEFLASVSSHHHEYKKLGRGVGFLQEGFAANFCVLEFTTHRIEKKNLKTKVGHSPFDGHTFPGKAHAVFSLGERLL
jgi:dihydroorotase